MQEEKAPAQMDLGNINKKKILGIILLILAVTGLGMYQFLSEKVRQAAVHNLLAMANEKVNGHVVVESIDLSILGAVKANKVKVFDKSGQEVAAFERILIRYRWRDLFKGQLGGQLITRMTIDKPEVWLVYRDGKSNVEDLIKPQKDEQADFSGRVIVRDGTINFEMAPFKHKIEQLNGTVDFSQENVVTASVGGIVETGRVNMDGQWGSAGSSFFYLTGKGLELAKLGLTTADDPVQITAGMLDELTVKCEGTAGKMVLQSAEGRFSGVSTNGELEVTQAGARFTVQDNGINFTEINALYKGQPLTGTGRVINNAEGNQTLNFAVDMPAANPAAIIPNVNASGNLAANAAITGSARAPVIVGTFTLGGIEFGGMDVSGISGSFNYTPNVFTLLTSTGTTNGGSVSANGVIYPETGKYRLSISGSGLNSSQMTTKDVSGPLSFSGTAAGDANSALAQGSFSINDGKAYGISFRLLTGNFVKRSSAEAEISNLAITTALGTFYPEQLNQDVLNKVNETAAAKNIPTSIDAVKKAAADKLIQHILR